MKTVLLALGDPDLRDACLAHLDSAGVATLVLQRPLAALSLAPKVEWDAVLVDATPLGLGTVATLPPHDPRAVVIGIGLVDGADLSIGLPLQPAQLEAALGRNGNGHYHPDTLALVLDPARRIALANGSEVLLTRTEFRLLTALYERRPDDVSLGEVLEVVWGSREGVGTAELVRTHIRNLRQKLQQIGLSDAVRAKRGRGYTLEA